VMVEITVNTHALLLKLHRDDGEGFCFSCGTGFPCKTWQILDPPPGPTLVERMLTAWYGDEGNPRATDRTSMAAALAVVRADVEELPSWPSIKVHELLALLDGGDK